MPLLMKNIRCKWRIVEKEKNNLRYHIKIRKRGMTVFILQTIVILTFFLWSLMACGIFPVKGVCASSTSASSKLPSSSRLSSSLRGTTIHKRQVNTLNRSNSYTVLKLYSYIYIYMSLKPIKWAQTILNMKSFCI